jgi:DNA-binding beta-propeller fold protein YncE
LRCNAITELNPSTGKLVRVLSSSKYHLNYPLGVSSDGKHVWVTNYKGNSVTELNATTGGLVAVLSSSKYGFNEPRAISSDGTHVWVTNQGSNSVTELNGLFAFWRGAVLTTGSFDRSTS